LREPLLRSASHYQFQKEYYKEAITFDQLLVILKRRYTEKDFNIFYQSKHVASNNTIKEQLMNNHETRAKLEEINKIDIQLYEFVVKELYQKFQKEYGDTLDLDTSNFKEVNSHSTEINSKLLMQFLKRRLYYRPILFCCRLMTNSGDTWPVLLR
jgi:hypothetical protein